MHPERSFTLRVLHINYHSSSGGATRSMLRLHRGLVACGTQSRLLVREGDATDEVTDRFEAEIPETSRLNEQLFGYFLQHKGADVHRTEACTSIFTVPFPGFDLVAHPKVQEADVINLHWPSYLLSPVTLGRLMDLGKPVFWTIHDQWAFTGGCHYSAGCEGYTRDCRDCPQLAGELSRLPAAIHRERRRQLRNRTLHVVGPSRWIVDCARRSTLLRDQPVHHVPYGIETDIFRPADQGEARAALGLPSDGFILLFGADHLAEKRKGWHHLHAALDRVSRKLGDSVPLHLAYFGNTPDDLAEIPVTKHELGYIRDDEKLRLAYSAADLFLLPSLEDNQPNTVMEAMACGTPVAGFAVGALPDMITDSENGYLARVGDPEALSESIMRCARSPESRRSIRTAARRSIETHYPLETQARNYLGLYAAAVARAKPARMTVRKAESTCAMSGDSGGMLDDIDALRPLGQLLKAEVPGAAPFDPGWSFGRRKEKRRVQHYTDAWLTSLPRQRRYYLTDAHGIYSHAEISLGNGFRVPEGPYPEMNLPWPLVWARFPEATFRFIRPIAVNSRLRMVLQTPVDGLDLEIDGPKGLLWHDSLRANLSNPSLEQPDLRIDLPPMESQSALTLRFRSIQSPEPSGDLAAAIFSLRIESI
ncbi:MAG: glycosyltransferase family 4 protein [Opitutaceae bacterium]